MKTAFGCVTLQTGTLIIGWLGMVNLIFDTVALVWKYSRDEPTAYPKDIQQQYATDDITDKIYTTVVAMPEICVASFLAVTAVLVSLLYGAYKRRPGFLLPYIVTTSILVFLALVGIFGSFISGASGGMMPIQFVIVLGIQIYFTAIVWNYYEELKAGAKTFQNSAVLQV